MFELWSEVGEVDTLYRRFKTQWRIGFNGPTGLDYTPVQHHLQRMETNNEDYDRLMAGLSVLEDEVITIMSERKDG